MKKRRSHPFGKFILFLCTTLLKEKLQKWKYLRCTPYKIKTEFASFRKKGKMRMKIRKLTGILIGTLSEKIKKKKCFLMNKNVDSCRYIK